MKPTKVPIWLMSSIGLRPWRSDAWPMSGPDSSMHTAKTDTSSVAWSGVAPSDSA